MVLISAISRCARRRVMPSNTGSMSGPFLGATNMSSVTDELAGAESGYESDLACMAATILVATPGVSMGEQ